MSEFLQLRIWETHGVEAWAWLMASLFVGAFWSNLASLFSPWADPARAAGKSQRSLAERIVYRLASWDLAPTAYEWLRFAYFAGVPAAALFWGRDAVVGRFLGLQPFLLPSKNAASPIDSVGANWASWIHDLGWAAGIAFSSLAVLLLARGAYRRAVGKTSEKHQEMSTSSWRCLRETVYRESHWAFYRNAPIVAFGLYWGTWAGLSLVALEALINPAWRKRIGNPFATWSVLCQGAIGIVSAVLFLQTQNLWLSLIVHWSIAAATGAYEAPFKRLPCNQL